MEDREYAYRRLHRQVLFRLRQGKVFRFLHASKAVCLLSLVVYNYVLNYCGRWRNRTPTNGFGDRCSTTKLIAQWRYHNTKNKKSPEGTFYLTSYFCFFMLSGFLTFLAILIKPEFCGNQFLIFTCVIVCTFANTAF